jgi:hypothetical protein
MPRKWTLDYARAYQRAYQQRKRDEFRARGVCVICGGPRTDGHKNCRPCLWARNHKKLRRLELASHDASPQTA